MNGYNLSSYPATVRSLTSIPAVVQDELWVAEQCREAMTCLERALLAPPLQQTREIATAGRTLNHLRVRICGWANEEKNSAQSDWKKTLARLDTVLELLSGVQYPSAPARRKPVEQARQFLQEILLDGLF